MPITGPDGPSTHATDDAVHVAVGVIFDQQGRVLTARRADHLHQGGHWEFPGGKLEGGESVLAALARELDEELGILIEPEQCFPLKRLVHHYHDKSVLLDVWRVAEFTGIPAGREGQQLRWQHIDNLQPALFPAADEEIIRILKLPRIIAVSGDFGSAQELEQRLASLVAQGIGHWQLRMRNSAWSDYLRWALTAVEQSRRCKLEIQLNCAPELAKQIPGAGLHVSSEILRRLDHRPIDRNRLFSASCHNLEELKMAASLDADFVFLSPVRATASHPSEPVLGWAGFRQLADQVHIPVFALGGLGAEDLDEARASGAEGIAGITAFWDRAGRV